MAQVSLEQKVDKLADSVAEISEVLAHVVSNMATKDDIAQLREEISAMATKEDVRSMIDRAKEEIMDVVRPVEKAVDGDAVTIVGHKSALFASKSIWS